MLIDWFTVLAQILNFLVLVWLLKKFLYQPILKAIDEREAKIKNRLQEADTKVESAEEAREAFRRKREEFEATRATRFDTMTAAVRQSRKQLLEEARADAAALRAQLIESVREEKEAWSRDISRRMQEEVFAISRKVLRDLASADLEQEVVHTFVKRIQEMEGSDREQLTAVLSSPQEAIVVRSAFELPAAQQREIEDAIAELLDRSTPCRFETTPEKILGLEVTAGGHKVAWSVAEYLYSLEKALSDILHEEARQGAETEKKTTVDESSEG